MGSLYHVTCFYNSTTHPGYIFPCQYTDFITRFKVSPLDWLKTGLRTLISSWGPLDQAR